MSSSILSNQELAAFPYAISYLQFPNQVYPFSLLARINTANIGAHQHRYPDRFSSARLSTTAAELQRASRSFDTTRNPPRKDVAQALTVLINLIFTNTYPLADNDTRHLPVTDLQYLIALYLPLQNIVSPQHIPETNFPTIDLDFFTGIAPLLWPLQTSLSGIIIPQHYEMNFELLSRASQAQDGTTVSSTQILNRLKRMPIPFEYLLPKAPTLMKAISQLTHLLNTAGAGMTPSDLRAFSSHIQSLQVRMRAAADYKGAFRSHQYIDLVDLFSSQS